MRVIRMKVEQIKVKDIVGRKLSRSNRMLVREAYKRGVQFEILSNKTFRMIQKDKKYLVSGGKISHSFNSKLAIKVTKYKDVTSRLLRNGGFPAPENYVFNKYELNRAWNWAQNILPVVLKPNDGIMGKHVYVKIDDYAEFKHCFQKIAEQYDKVLVEKYIEGEEYRFTYVKGEIVAIANRIPANVIGDGVKTIRELVEEKNAERERRNNPIHKKLVLDEESERVLKRQGFTFDSIPIEGVRVFLRNNSNVSTGGDAVDVTDLIDENIKKQVQLALKSIPGLRVCGADVLISGESFHIIEINTHPMLSMHHFPWEGKERDVIGKVIDAMFPNTVQ